MRILTTLILLLILTVTFGQLTDEHVRINWKIKKKEIIAYRTIMSEIEETKFQGTNYMNSLMDSLGLKELSNLFDFAELTKQLKKESENYETISTLQNSADLIYVRMVRKLKDGTISTSTGFIDGITKGIQFRGYLSKKGDIYSYYLKSQQKNILALLFQLPSTKVKVGDSWSVDSQWFTADQSFKCEKAERVNQVTLEKLIIEKRDTIALISYNLRELMEGETQIPWSKEVKKSRMTMTYKGVSEFNITQGRWEKFAVIMDLETTGLQNIKQKILYSLTPYKLDKGDIEILETD